MFPIFNKNFNGNNEKQGIADFASLYKSSKDWIPIGEQQYQIDAGQKAFGLKQCPTCDMQYSVHEPEDELLHLKYHNSVNILSFKGWNNEPDAFKVRTDRLHTAAKSGSYVHSKACKR